MYRGMSDVLLIRQVRVVSEDSPVFREADVRVEKGMISAVAPGLPVPANAKVIEGRGRLLMPAMFDAHVHFREPGFEAKEDIASGTEAAINGGITGVVMRMMEMVSRNMPRTKISAMTASRNPVCDRS